MSAKNEAIGEVLCPNRECERKVPVFRYRERGDSAVSVANRRRAGKLYCRCPDHGQMDPQEYLLAKATIWGAKKAADEPPAAEKETPAKPASPLATPAPAKPQNKPPATPAKQSRGWGFFQP